jgi:hypothetical protein
LALEPLGAIEIESPSGSSCATDHESGPSLLGVAARPRTTWFDDVSRFAFIVFVDEIDIAIATR